MHLSSKGIALLFNNPVGKPEFSFDIQMSLIFSKSLIPNLRRKIDIVRAITEKTESDLANASLKFNKDMSAYEDK